MSNHYSNIYFDPSNFSESLKSDVIRVNQMNSQTNAMKSKKVSSYDTYNNMPNITCSGICMSHAYYSQSGSVVRNIIGN